MVGIGMVRHGRHGAFRISKVGQGKAGAGRFGRSGSGLAESGKVRQARLGGAWLFLVWLVMAG